MGIVSLGMAGALALLGCGTRALEPGAPDLGMPVASDVGSPGDRGVVDDSGAPAADAGPDGPPVGPACAPARPGTWRNLSTDGMPTLNLAAVVWTGSEVMVWGGYDRSTLATGAAYDTAGDRWRPLATAGAPSARAAPSAVWTGTEMFVFGGSLIIPGPSGDATSLVDGGGRYDPAADRWTPISMDGAPSPRSRATVVWTGQEVLVWGGTEPTSVVPFGDGGRYDPTSDSWRPISTVDAPPLATNTYAYAWTGHELLVWGGAIEDGVTTNGGARYDPAADRWTPMSSADGPPVRAFAFSTFTGGELVVWSSDYDGPAGGRYDLVNDRWTAMTMSCDARRFPFGAWAGDRLILVSGWAPMPCRCCGLCDVDVFTSALTYDPATDRWSLADHVGGPPITDDSGQTQLDPNGVVWTGQELLFFGQRDPNLIAAAYTP
jgi:hypothetical protein